MHAKIIEKQNLWWKCVAFLGIIILSVIFFNTPGTGDMDIWNTWLDYAEQYGIREGYSMQKDMYPPFALILQIGIKKMWPALSNFDVLRLANIFFLLISVFVIHILYKNGKITILSFLGLILSANLGYLDIEMVPFLILAFYFFSKDKYILSGIFYSFLCLIKFQPLIILPFVCIYFVDIFDADKRKIKLNIKIKSLVKMAMPAIVIGAGVCLIYRRALIKALYNALFTSGYSISPNALNFGWVLQFWLEKFHADIFGPLDNGKIAIIWSAPKIYLSFKYIFVFLYALAAIVMLLNRKKDYKLMLQCSVIGYTAYFLYNSGVHENHLFLGMILMILLYLADPTKNNYYRMIMYIVIFNVNLLILYGMSGHGMGFDRAISGLFDPTLILAIFNVVYLTITLIGFIYEATVQRVQHQ